MVGYNTMAQGNKHEGNKSNIMLCDKHVMCGSCPYEGRCKYIHDKALVAPHDFFLKRCRHDKECVTKECANNKDSFYWPNMPKISGYGGGCYDISACCDPKFFLRHRSVYSIWKHFKQFCIDQATPGLNRDPILSDSTVTVNQYTCASRLSVFVSLSNGQSIRTQNLQSEMEYTATINLPNSEQRSPSRRSDSDLSDASSSDLSANAAAYFDADAENSILLQQQYESNQRNMQLLYQMTLKSASNSACPSRSQAYSPAPSCHNSQYVTNRPMYAALVPRDSSRGMLQGSEQAARKSWVL